MEIKEEDKCTLNPTTDKHHVFEIIPGSGAQDGTPTWICKYCNKQVKSN